MRILDKIKKIFKRSELLHLSGLNYKRMCVCKSFKFDSCKDCKSYIMSIYNTNTFNKTNIHIIELGLYNFGINEKIIINGEEVSYERKRALQKLMVANITRKDIFDDGLFTWEDYENDD